ncbi:MAG: AEC family transporter [Betaproteobacteria bacterium]|nr:AEC family transporter [Betaproteobacteria bacterium]MDH5221697.1 AEC family transporter [Betaproteobacteria bacterium]MDH5350852.1 AEC family transporter [Betaproteobacteria bacterium]
MQNFVLLLVCFALGVLLRRSGRLPEATPAALNGFIVHVSLPALTLHHLRHLEFDASLAAPLAMAWLLFAAGVAFFFAAQRLWRWPAATTGALILTGALGNTSFVGVPMIECFFGREHVALGILIDQLGTYVVLSTVGLLVAATLSSGELSARAVAHRIFTFPPFLAVLAALALAPVALPQWIDAVLLRLGDTLAPLALLSVGFQLRFAAVRERWQPLAAGLGFKLVAGPLAVLAVFAAFADLDSPAMQVAVFEAAMAPMIGGAIVAAQHKLDPELTTLMVGIGIPLSFLTVPAWWFALAVL